MSLDRALEDAGRGEPDLDEQRAFGAFQARLFGRSGAALRVGGRYELGPLIGAGGVGAVYRAHDPELDRDVALKVLRASDPAVGAKQLLHEAQTIAKLSHPNVVEIYDAGLHRSDAGTPQVFVVMELVAGLDLHRALDEQAWSGARIVETFVAAGKGLAAAHAAGLVHRDFKPHNVLLGEAGAVKVADFGAGPVVGTPRYMSPEQRDGGVVDARSDQYSYCVALYEALEGQRPRPTFDAPLREPTERTTRRVWRALRRGLSRDPSHRFASMDALLSGLQRPRAGTWITLGLVGAGAAGLFAWSVTESPAGCPSVDELQEEVWSSRRRAEVEASIRVAAPRRADEVWTMLAPMLDDYADTWARHHADACGVSADRTMTCLGRRRHAFTTLVEVLLEADASVVDRAPGATRRLPELQSCLDPQAAGGIPEPSDPAIRARVAELDARLTRVKTLEAAGRYRDAVHLAQATLADAEEVDHDPTTAFAAYRLGVVLVDAGRGDEAMPLLERAAFLALETGLDIVVAGAAIKLIARYAAHGDDEQVESWRRHAMAAIERGGLPQDVEARVHLELGAVAYAHTDFEAARTEAETAAKLYAASVGEEDPEYATAVNNMAGALFSLGEHDEALELMERSSAIRQRVLGPTHPMMQTSLSNLGSIAIQLDRLDEAERHLAQAREAYEADPTPHHMRHANLLLAEGALARRRGRFDDAVETILASLDASGRVGGPSSVVHDFRAHMQLVLVFTDARREADAVETADALVSSCEAIGACSDAHMLRAVTLAEFGRDDEARAARDRAQVLGPLDADLETSLAELLRQ